MAITPDVLQNLAKMVDLHIESLNSPVWGGQPQVFQLRPTQLLLSAAGDLLPTETVLRTAIPVRLEATWGVEDVDGTPLGPDQAVTHAGTGQKSPQVAVMVLPDFVELRRDQVITTKTRYVTAKAKLIASVVDLGSGMARDVVAEVPLLRYPITVPAIPVPTAALFFHGANLDVVDGELAPADHYFVLIAVPEDSAIAGISALRDACETLRRLTFTASQLVQLAGFALNVGLPSLTGLDAGLGTLLTALNVHKVRSNIGVGFAAGDKIRNLNDIELVRGRFNDIEAEDEISSLVLLGPPGRRLSVFRDRGFSGRGATITSSDLCITIVNSLSDVPPITEPPGLSVQVAGPPLDNRISSIAFL